MYDDFWRLSQGLRAVIIDYDYRKTRKILDPKWDGYRIPKGADIQDDDCPLIEANLLTSMHRDSDLHRIVLDLDYGARYIPCQIVSELQLNMNAPIWFALDDKLFKLLHECGIPHRMPPQIYRTGDGNGRLDIYTNHDLALIPSTTPGHFHLIMNVNLTWPKYTELLNMLSSSGIIQSGYAKASIAKGFSAIRPPWIKKETSCPNPLLPSPSVRSGGSSVTPSSSTASLHSTGGMLCGTGPRTRPWLSVNADIARRLMSSTSIKLRPSSDH